MVRCAIVPTSYDRHIQINGMFAIKPAKQQHKILAVAAAKISLIFADK